MHYPLRLLLSAPPSVRLQPETFVYVAAVEAQDGQALEPSVVTALDAFVVGCKADGIWNAIKASCILAGARTLSGALVPLVGTAPTNFNFVSGDYDRKTGLVGNGTTKYLDSNRNSNADPQNSSHVSVWLNTAGTPSSSTQVYAGANSVTTGGVTLGIASSQLFSRNRNASAIVFGTSIATGLFGSSRSESATYITRDSGANTTRTQTSQAPASASMHIFGESAGSSFRSNARIAFYSIGESLDLALLDARVTTLINAIGAAIP